VCGGGGGGLVFSVVACTAGTAPPGNQAARATKQCTVQPTAELADWLAGALLGQVTVDLMVNPPKPGEASYALYKQVGGRVFTDLFVGAAMLTEIHIAQRVVLATK
jgi:hypothetical protein